MRVVKPRRDRNGVIGMEDVRCWRVVDDDGEIYAEWDWSFKLAKESVSFIPLACVVLTEYPGGKVVDTSQLAFV